MDKIESICRIMVEDNSTMVLTPNLYSSTPGIPGVYVMWIHGQTKVGRSQNVYGRYLSYIDGRSDNAENVFLIGFMAALPGEDLSDLEQKLIDTCLEFGIKRVSGREWFPGENASECLHALSVLSGERKVPNHDIVLPPTKDLPITEILFPMYVSVTKRTLTYLVMAIEFSTGNTVVDITTTPFRPSWLVLACYVQDPGAQVNSQELSQTLEKGSKWDQIRSFFGLNAEESDIFFYTDPRFYVSKNE